MQTVCLRLLVLFIIVLMTPIQVLQMFTSQTSRLMGRSVINLLYQPLRQVLKQCYTFLSSTTKRQCGSRRAQILWFKQPHQ